MEAPRRSWPGSQELTSYLQPRLSCSRSRGQIKISVSHTGDGVNKAKGGFGASLASRPWREPIFSVCLFVCLHEDLPCLGNLQRVWTSC